MDSSSEAYHHYRCRTAASRLDGRLENGVLPQSAGAESRAISADSSDPAARALKRCLIRRGVRVAVEFSVVIPAFNERDRLPAFLDSVTTHLEKEFPNSFEVVVADDGSTDGMPVWLMEVAKGNPAVRTVRLPQNRGKGAAVREGVLASKGSLVLFCDADGATPIEEERRLRTAINDGADVAVGSRFIGSPSVEVRRDASRRLAGTLFSAVARFLLRAPVRDTQCGFKMFRGDVGRMIAAEAKEDGYLFDLEWLCLAQKSGCTIAEVGVNWTEMPGSKLRVGRDGFKIVRSLFRLRRRLKDRP
jgi:dolichyl-phosphate beta-glucosyltransferase